MDLTSNINKNNLFHAYVLAGGAPVLASLQEHIVSEFGIEVKANLSLKLSHKQETIMKTRKYINDRGVIFKMLLESVTT